MNDMRAPMREEIVGSLAKLPPYVFRKRETSHLTKTFPHTELSPQNRDFSWCIKGESATNTFTKLDPNFNVRVLRHLNKLGIM